MTVGEEFQRIRTHDLALAFAVKPVDAVTGRPLRNAATVSIDGVPEEPIRNPSEYWLFLTPPVKLPDDPVTVSVDAGRDYVDVPYEIHVGNLTSPGMVLPVHPSVEYPFAAHETVIEGCVKHDGEPAAGATVTLEGVGGSDSNGDSENGDTENGDSENGDTENGDSENGDTENRDPGAALEAIGGDPPVTVTDGDGSFALLVRGIVRSDIAMDEPLRIDTESEDPNVVKYYPNGAPVTPQLSVIHDGESKTEDVTFNAGEWTKFGSIDLQS